MASHFILLADDLKDNSVTGWERSVTLRKIAKYFSEKLKLNIKLVYVDDLSNETKHLTQFDSKRIATWQKKIQSAFRGAKSALPSKAELAVKIGSPAERISELISTDPRPDLVIMGTRNRSAIRKLFLGSVSEEVVRHSERPIMVCGPNTVGTTFTKSKDKKLNMIVFTDLQRNSVRAEKYAVYLAKKLGANLTLCLSVGDQAMGLRNTLYASGYIPNNLEDTIRYMYEDAADSLLKKVNQFKKLGLVVEGKILSQESPLSKVIAAEIKRNYDLVVMGTHGRSQVMKAFIGSSTRSAILKATIPVIVVPS